MKMTTIKRLYLNGRFPTHTFNLYAYWNSFIYVLFKYRKSDVPPLIITAIVSFVLFYFVILKK